MAPGTEVIQRLTRYAELGAGAFLAIIMALTFASVVLRYLFNIAIPDAYDLGRLLLGILIFWGIAVTGFRGEHITVDALWNVLPARGRRRLDLFATLFSLAAMVAFAAAMGRKALDVAHTHEATYDTGTPIWPFYALAWLGTVAAVLLLIVRLVRQWADAADEPGAAAPVAERLGE